MESNEVKETPRIYVASLADYNAGTLHGRWIDADQPADVIREQISQMLAESEEPIAEEWAIHDYENFAGYELHESANIDHVAEVAHLISEHGDVFAGLLNHFAGDLEDAKRFMLEAYRGEWHSLEEYAQELVEDAYHAELEALPDFVRYHIDFKGIGHDLELSGDLFTIECGSGVHIFEQL